MRHLHGMDGRGIIPRRGWTRSKTRGADGRGVIPWRGWTWGNPVALMDAGHPHGKDGRRANPQRRRTRGIRVALMDTAHPRGADVGTPMAQLDAGYPRGAGGCGTSPPHSWMRDIPRTRMDAQVARRVPRTAHHQITAGTPAASRHGWAARPRRRSPCHTGAARCQRGACESAVMDRYNSRTTV